MPSLRVAAVQLDFQPAYNRAGVDLLPEPLAMLPESATCPKLFELEERLRRIGGGVAEDALKTLEHWRIKLRDSYLHWFDKKLAAILRAATKERVDLLLFPEYSIPCEQLSKLRAGFRRGTLIAGTHTITAGCLDRCKRLGIKLTKADIGAAICPIISALKCRAVQKLEVSKWELYSQRGRHWRPQQLALGKERFNLLVYVCADFIADRQEPAGRLMSARRKSATSVSPLSTIVAVPALTPTIEDFVARAISLTKRADQVVLFANFAPTGGSRIFFDNPSIVVPLAGQGGSWSFGPGEEGMVIVEIERAAITRHKRSSPLPIPPPPVRQVGVLPVHYLGVTEQDAAIGRLASTAQRAMREAIERELPHLPPTLGSATLRTKILELKGRIVGLGDSDAAMLAGIIALPLDIPTMEEWRYRASFSTASLLEQQASKGEAGRECADYARAFRRAATALGSQGGIAYSLEELPTEDIAAEDYLSEELTVASHIAAAPSSGEVEAALVKWLQASLEDGRPAEVCERVVKLVEKFRPYPTKRTSQELLAVLGANGESRAKTISLCGTHKARLEEARTGLLKAALRYDLFHTAEHILVYGYSGSILAAFDELVRERGARRLVVGVVECRNRFGVDSAPRQIERLRQMGLSTRFVTGESLARYLSSERPQCVLFGANAIIPDGVIDTMGSLGVAMLATITSTPSIVMTTSRKIWTSAMWDTESRRLLSLRRPTESFLPASFCDDGRTEMIAFAYDLVPFRYVDALITDRGVFAPKVGQVGELFSRV